MPLITTVSLASNVLLESVVLLPAIMPPAKVTSAILSLVNVRHPAAIATIVGEVFAAVVVGALPIPALLTLLVPLDKYVPVVTVKQVVLVAAKLATPALRQAGA